MKASFNLFETRTAMAVLAALCCLHFSAGIMAQNLLLTPSVSVSETYDDNIFFNTNNEESDFITRVTPALNLSYLDERLTVTGQASFDAEYFVNNSSQTDIFSRQHAELDSRFRVTQRQTLSLGGSYTDTLQPGELNPLSGFDSGRANAERLTLSGSYGYVFSNRLSGNLGYIQSTDDVQLGTDTEFREAYTGLAYEVTPFDTPRLGVRARQFDFEGSPTRESLTPYLGWNHQFNRNFTLDLEGGPQMYEDGEDQIYFAVRADYTDDDNVLSLSVNRDESLIIGQPETVTNEAVQLSWTRRINDRLDISASPRLSRIEGMGLEADVTILSINSFYRLNERISLFAAFEHSDQFQKLPGIPGLDVGRNIFTVGFRTTFNRPLILDEEERREIIR